MSVIDSLNYSNEVFRVYITWGGLLLVKLLLMAFLTGMQRFKTGAFANPEDPGEVKTDEKVERVRRAHLNDLENIPAFLIAALFYVMSEPNPDVATWLIRIAVLARIGHTIVYAVYPVRQPARGICFFICLLITFFMIFWSISKFFHI